DLYAVGLVLYEMLTGHRLLKSQSLDQLRKLQSDSDALRSSASDVHLDPAVERVIMRCVEPDAARRPASALAVSASLPGGDPLAAALCAGETPSPEIVAAAGDDTSLSPLVLAALVVVAVVGCAIAGGMRAKKSALAVLHPSFSAEVLSVK